MSERDQRMSSRDQYMSITNTRLINIDSFGQKCLHTDLKRPIYVQKDLQKRPENALARANTG